MADHITVSTQDADGRRSERITMTAEQFESAANNIARALRNNDDEEPGRWANSLGDELRYRIYDDWQNEIQTRADRLVAEIIENLGAVNVAAGIRNGWDYHEAFIAVHAAIKTITKALGDVRTEWTEDSALRIKASRKYRARLAAGQSPMWTDPLSDERDDDLDD